VECVPLLMEPDGASYHGHEGIRRWLDELFGVFPDFGADIQEVRDFGDLLVVAALTRGQGVGSDVPFQATVWQVVEIRDGKVVRWRNYWSEAEALEAAGRRDWSRRLRRPRASANAKSAVPHPGEAVLGRRPGPLEVAAAARERPGEPPRRIDPCRFTQPGRARRGATATPAPRGRPAPCPPTPPAAPTPAPRFS
jgi:hypothetical protein